MRKVFFLILAMVSMTTFVNGAITDPVKAELISEVASVQPGKPFTVMIHLQLEDGWHSYWKNPGDAGMAPDIVWKLPEQSVPGEIEWPAPHRYLSRDSVTYGYEKDVYLLAEIKPSADLQYGDDYTLEATIRWVVCSDSDCLPGESHVTLTVPVGRVASRSPDKILLFTKARRKVPQEMGQAVAVKNQENILLNLQDLDLGGKMVSNAYFCPEEPNMVNEKTNVQIQKQSENSVELQLEQSEFDVPSVISGVMVLELENSKTIAVEINTLIGDASIPADETGFLLALALAFGGGLILNLMPCVLPVISFKVMSFVKMANQSRAQTFKHGLMFAVGVLFSFWILAGVLLALKAYGNTVGWGFQLQEPLFVGILAAFLFLFGLSLFGLFEIGAIFASKAGGLQDTENEGYMSSFMSGVLATAVATPCTGPFLGTAVGFAVTQPAMLAMLIFTTLGLGMAFPYVVLGAFPSLLRFLPKPGNWMVTFKELMGFVMIATVLWLLWVFSAQTSSVALLAVLFGFFLMAIGGWVYGKYASPIQSKATRMLGTAIAVILLGAGSVAIYQATTLPTFDAVEEVAMAEIDLIHTDQWVPFDAEKLADLQARGIPVFVDFTAKWCLTCQANHAVLSTPSVKQKLGDRGVIKMKADWTRHDDKITHELEKFGRNSVPLYLYYGPNANGKPEILPQVLTPGTVLNAVN